MKSVVDASFIASLFLPDEASKAGDRIADEIAREGAAAPSLLQLEMTNILLMAHRRKRISGVQFQHLSEALDQLPIALQPALTPKQRAEVLRLAERHGLTAYDAAYLELAMRLSLPLASLDKPLLKATKAEGVAAALG